MFAEGLVALLTEAGVGTLGTNIFVSSQAVLPPGDGPYLSIRETGGTAPLRTHNSVAMPAYVRPSAQIVARAKSYPSAAAMASAAYAAVAGVRNRMVDGVWYREVNPLQEPFDMGTDESGRVKVGFNVMAVKRP